MVQEEVQYVTDIHGARMFVQIPIMTWERMKIELGWDDHKDNGDATSELIDKQGILVVRATPLADLGNITRQERNRRVGELIRSTGV